MSLRASYQVWVLQKGKSALLTLVSFPDCHRINPFWKLSLVFKCLSDNIILDNFRSVLNQLSGLGIQGTAATPQHLSEILLTKSDQVSRIESEDPRLPSSELAISNTVCAIPAEDELPDGLNLGRKQTRPRSAVRSVGLKIQQLPHIITR